MKRKVLLLSILSCMVVFAACGTDSATQPQEVDEATAEQAEKAGEEEEEVEPKEVTVEEAVLYEQDGIKITAKSLEKDSFDTNLKLLIENDSEKDITVQARDANINGCMIDSCMSCDVAAGKKANDELSFGNSDLEYCYINTIKDISFRFCIAEEGSLTDFIKSEPIVVTTSADENFVQEFEDEGRIIFDSNDIKIVSKGVYTNDMGGVDVELYIENNSDKNIMIQARDESINGFMADGIFSTEILSGKKAYDNISFWGDTFEDNGITVDDITDIEFSFHIVEKDGWDNICDSEPITITRTAE